MVLCSEYCYGLFLWRVMWVWTFSARASRLTWTQGQKIGKRRSFRSPAQLQTYLYVFSGMYGTY
jgi:hypothetical protein